VSGPTDRRDGIALVAISTIVWSTSGLFVRLLALDPWAVTAGRAGVGAIVLALYVLWRSGATAPRAVARMGARGVRIGIYSAVAIVVFVPALQQTSVANVMTIYAGLPFIVAALACVRLGERPAAHTLIASAVATVGLMVMLGGPGSVGMRLGDLLALAGTLVTAMMTVEARRGAASQMLPATLLANVLAALMTLPFAGALLGAGTWDWGVILALGLCGASVGLVLYLIGSALIPAALSALISTVSVPAGVFWAWVGVGELPSAGQALGAAIVLTGVVGALLQEQRARRLAA
jgi:drug/metabolite transporter (DMT)-like permease